MAAQQAWYAAWLVLGCMLLRRSASVCCAREQASLRASATLHLGDVRLLPARIPLWAWLASKLRSAHPALVET
jgi:hypothetical protein